MSVDVAAIIDQAAARADSLADMAQSLVEGAVNALGDGMPDAPYFSDVYYSGGPIQPTVTAPMLGNIMFMPPPAPVTKPLPAISPLGSFVVPTDAPVQNFSTVATPKRANIPSAPNLKDLPDIREPQMPALPTMSTLAQLPMLVQPPPLSPVAEPILREPNLPAAPSLVELGKPVAPNVNFTAREIDVPDVTFDPMPALTQIVLPPAPTLLPIEFDGVPPEFSDIPPDVDVEAMGNRLASNTLAVSKNEASHMMHTLFPNLNSLQSLLEGKLQELVTTGGMMSVGAEEAMYARGHLKIDQEYLSAKDSAFNESSRRGFRLPAGVLVSSVNKARRSAVMAQSNMSVEVAIKQAEISQRNIEFALNQLMAMKNTATEVVKFTMNAVHQVVSSAFSAASAATNAVVEIYRTKVTAFNAQVESYKVGIEAVKARITVEMGKLQVYQATLDGLKTLTQVDQAKLDAYKTRIDAAVATMSLYKTQVEAEALRLQNEKLKIEGFKAQVEAFMAEVTARKSDIELYEAQLSGERMHLEIKRDKV